MWATCGIRTPLLCVLRRTVDGSCGMRPFRCDQNGGLHLSRGVSASQQTHRRDRNGIALRPDISRCCFRGNRRSNYDSRRAFARKLGENTTNHFGLDRRLRRMGCNLRQVALPDDYELLLSQRLEAIENGEFIDGSATDDRRSGRVRGKRRRLLISATGYATICENKTKSTARKADEAPDGEQVAPPDAAAYTRVFNSMFHLP